MASIRALINEFMAQKELALVRASRKKPVYGFLIDKEFAARGYSVSVVYLDEDEPGTTLADLKDTAGGVIIAVPAKQTEQAVRQALAAKIPRIWMQLGSESPAAIALCAEEGIPLVHGECVMMFAEPVKSFHAFHRWIRKIMGKLPV